MNDTTEVQSPLGGSMEENDSGHKYVGHFDGKRTI